jgi:hypothetical protein
MLVADQPPAGVISHLQSTVKTHKPQGVVTFRATHASQSSFSGPVLKYISWCVTPVLKGLPNLMGDSHQVCDLLRTKTVLLEARCYKVDVKGFFMSGDTGTVISSCQQYVSEQERDRFITV